MLTGKRNVLQWFDASDGNYWKIYAFGQASNGANIVYQSSQDDNITHMKAREELDEALNILNGKFDIASTQAANRKPKGDWKVSFQLNQVEERSSNIAGVPQVMGLSEDEVDKRVKSAIDNYKRDEQYQATLIRLKELEKENKELTNSVGDPWNRIGEVAMPFIQGWLSKQFPGAAQVAGVPAPTTENPGNAHFEENGSVVAEIKLTEDEESRLANVITILHTIAPEIWLTKLEKLAAMVQANPSMLNMLN